MVREYSFTSSKIVDNNLPIAKVTGEMPYFAEICVYS